MEEQEKLQKELIDIGAEIGRVSAQAESAKDAEDKKYYRETVLMLRRKELLLLEKLVTLRAAAGSAAGLGVGSAEGAGPSACKLRLRQDSQDPDLFVFEPMDTTSAAAAASPGVSRKFFLDPEGRQTDGLQDWPRLAEDLHDEGQHILPLSINGQVKVGCNGLTKVGEHRVQLASPTCNRAWREKAVATESGELLDSIPAIPSICFPMHRELVVLGECCKDSEHFDRYKDLHSLLEDMASALALTPDGLLEADWFIQVLDHRCNSRGGKADFEQNHRAQARQDVKVGLRWFHALLCSVLSLGSNLEQRQALKAYPSKLAEFHSSGRISEALTKTYDIPMPRRSKAPGASAAATPRAQLQPHAGPVRPTWLHLGTRLVRAAVVQLRYMGRM